MYIFTMILKSFSQANWKCFHYANGQNILKRNRVSTSGIIVTGDEVLKGQVQDTNSHFFCQKFYGKGIKVVEISTVGDDVSTIASQVKSFSDKYDYVLTTGGIGPTHDDVTYEAVAVAFGIKLYQHPELSKIVLDFYKTNNQSHPSLKMALIPSGSKITYGFDSVTKKKTLYPNISFKNVFMFPGVPYLCERIFNLTHDILFPSKNKFYSKNLYLTQNESLIVDSLNKAVKNFPQVVFGSYPEFFHSYYNVKISMESDNESEVNNACESLKKLIPTEFHANFDADPFTGKKKKIESVRSQIFSDTLSELNKLFQEHNPNNIFLYFDGGKNSTILLYMMSALYEELHPKLSVNGIYVEINPDINKFVMNSCRQYKLNLLKLDENNFKSFAKSNLEMRVLKGTRKSDPLSGRIMEAFKELPCVNPISNWSYSDVWRIIRSLSLPYCQLYDQGYTSICHANARPNPHLKTTDPRSGASYYKKAFELENDSLENAT